MTNSADLTPKQQDRQEARDPITGEYLPFSQPEAPAECLNRVGPGAKLVGAYHPDYVADAEEDDDDDEDDEEVHVFSMEANGADADVYDVGNGQYEVFQNGDVIGKFTHHGDAEDHVSIEEAARAAVGEAAEPITHPRGTEDTHDIGQAVVTAGGIWVKVGENRWTNDRGVEHTFYMLGDRTELPQKPLSEEEFDAKYNLIPVPGTEDTTFNDFEAALAAADGIRDKVWAVATGDYHPGEKVWKFDFDGDEEIVSAETEEEALEGAAEAYNNRFDEELDDDDYERTESYTAEDAAGWDYTVYHGDAGDYEDEWVPARNTYIREHHPMMEATAFVVTDKLRSRSSESYVY